jgi:hypothetical protein
MAGDLGIVVGSDRLDFINLTYVRVAVADGRFHGIKGAKTVVGSFRQTRKDLALSRSLVRPRRLLGTALAVCGVWGGGFID